MATRTTGTSTSSRTSRTRARRVATNFGARVTPPTLGTSLTPGPSQSADGDRILDIAAPHEGEQYILGARAPMANAGWQGPWDCAEFVSWCVFRATGVLYGTEPRDDPVRADAFTGFWANHAAADQAFVSIEDAARTPGACVLRRPGANGIGHIALSDGRGGTIEAHSTKRGVVRDRISGRRWDQGILVPGVRYFVNEEPVPVSMPTDVLRVTSPLTRGPTVRKLQQALVDRGFHPGTVDGVYGPQTAHAVQAFQAENGLVADGEAGAVTLRALGLA